MLWKISIPSAVDGSVSSSLWNESSLASLLARRAHQQPCWDSGSTAKASVHDCEVVSDSGLGLDTSDALTTGEELAATSTSEDVATSTSEDALLPPLDEGMALSACFVEVKSQRSYAW